MITFPPALLAELDATAAELSITRSAAIETAAKMWLARRRAATTLAAREKRTS